MTAPVRWWHCFFGHRWTRWETGAVRVRGYLNPTIPEMGLEEWRSVDGQKRECSVCGKRQIRVIQ